MAKSKRRSRVDSSMGRGQPYGDEVKVDAVMDAGENDSEMLDELGKCPEGGCYVECGFMYRLRERRSKSA